MRPASLRSLRSTRAPAPRRGHVRGRAGAAAVAVVMAGAIAGLAIVLFGGGGPHRRAAFGGQRSTSAGAHWVTAWGAAVTRPPGVLGARGIGAGTVRIVVPTDVRGDAVRIALSNRWGDRPVAVGSATVGIASPSGALRNLRRLTFAGRTATTLPPGMGAQSDPVALAVPATGGRLAVSVWLPGGSGALTAHPGTSVPVYTAAGNRTGDRGRPSPAPRLAAVPLLSSVAVRTTTSPGAVVIIGGSLAEGGGGELAAALRAALSALPPAKRPEVIDEGLAGNRVLSSTPATGLALVSRMGPDALSLPGVRRVVVLAGTEDITTGTTGANGRTVAGLEQAYGDMIRAAARAGVALDLGTLPPPGGARPSSEQAQVARTEVNGWIRTAASGQVGAGTVRALDFDALLRDPRDWRRLRSSYATRSSPLPSAAGYRAIAGYARFAAANAGARLEVPPSPPLASSVLAAGAPAMLDLRDTPRGPTFSRGAVGLSVEASVLSGPTLDPRRGDLASIMRLLGPGVLRVAGDAADLSFWTATGERAPRWAQATITPADLSRLAALTRATGWRVLLTVNLGHFDPTRAAGEAAAAKRALGPALSGIEIGNEPDRYVLQHLRAPTGWGYGAYISELDRYRAAITAAAPGIPVAGPDLSSTAWTLRYARTEGRRDAQITQHYYPLWACQGARPSIADLLGTRTRAREDVLLGLLGRASSEAGHPATISETNSVACNGAAAVSPRFASALWALDWALRAGRRGVGPIEFHDQLAPCTSRTYSPLCAAGVHDAAAGRFSAQPVFYGLLAAAGLEGGSFLPVSIQGPDSITAYATRTAGGSVHLAVDNLSGSGRPQAVIALLPTHYRAAIQRLTAPSVTARAGVRFGAAEVGAAGSLRAPAATVPGGAGFLSLHLGPGSAALVTLTPAR